LLRERAQTLLARDVLEVLAMATRSEAWTIPFHVIMWTTLLIGLIMAIAVVLMH
jgi:hypothetical protein